MALMIVCAVALSIKQLIFGKAEKGSSSLNNDTAVIPPWLAVVGALVTVVSFALRILVFRKMTGPNSPLKFNVTYLVMGSFIYTNVLVFVAALIYWSRVRPIDWYIFGLSTLGSLIDILSINLLYFALSRGPGGPITAICSMSAVLALIIEAIKLRKAPTWIEFIGLIFGLIGALEFVVPHLVHRVFCCQKPANQAQKQRKSSDSEPIKFKYPDEDERNARFQKLIDSKMAGQKELEET